MAQARHNTIKYIHNKILERLILQTEIKYPYTVHELYNLQKTLQ